LCGTRTCLNSYPTMPNWSVQKTKLHQPVVKLGPFTTKPNKPLRGKPTQHTRFRQTLKRKPFSGLPQWTAFYPASEPNASPFHRDGKSLLHIEYGILVHGVMSEMEHLIAMCSRHRHISRLTSSALCSCRSPLLLVGSLVLVHWR
jgi:hypothetical protein